MYSFVDCSTSVQYNCNGATYENSNLKDFVEHCAPKPWEDFFGSEKVTEAIKLADTIRQPKQELDELRKEKNTVIKYHIEPPMQLMFEAFKRVSPKDIKVVILGQDPTPQEGKATGRAFSVEDPRTVPSALNVLMEVALEGWSVDLDNGDLSKWENQGVLLLNSALTIGQITYQDPKNKIKTQEVSHLGNWCPFTKLLINYISKLPEPSVWMLWGKVARDFTVDRKYNSFYECFNDYQASKTDLKTDPSLIEKGYVLTGGHPSSLGSAKGKNTFFAGNYFPCANIFLYKNRGVWVNWGLRVNDNGRHDVNNKLNPCP